MAQYKLKQLGDAATNLRSQGSALAEPLDDAAVGINEKQAQVTALRNADAPTADVHPAMGGNPTNKTAKYGDRPGEKRIDVNSMLSPLGSARAQGGPVEENKPYVVGEQGPEVIVPQKAGTVIPNEQLPLQTHQNFIMGPDLRAPNEKPSIELPTQETIDNEATGNTREALTDPLTVSLLHGIGRPADPEELQNKPLGSAAGSVIPRLPRQSYDASPAGRHQREAWNAGMVPITESNLKEVSDNERRADLASRDADINW